MSCRRRDICQTRQFYSSSVLAITDDGQESIGKYSTSKHSFLFRFGGNLSPATLHSTALHITLPFCEVIILLGNDGRQQSGIRRIIDLRPSISPAGSFILRPSPPRGLSAAIVVELARRARRRPVIGGVVVVVVVVIVVERGAGRYQ